MFFDTDSSAILLLEDGTYFEGLSFGAVGTISGEVVFNTGMTGYQEVITDPSYHGQLILLPTQRLEILESILRIMNHHILQLKV